MNYYKDIIYYLELALINNQGNHVSGKTVTYNIYKSSDNTLFTSGTLTEIGVTGVYKDDIIFTETIQYRVQYTTPSKYSNVIETVIIEDISHQDIYAIVKKILGLTQENFRLNDLIYDANGCLTSGKIAIYNSASDVDTETNPIATYTITGTYNAQTQLTDYKVKED